jgi:hypothetical protein
MLKKVVHYVTWGEPTLETVKRLLKRAEFNGRIKLKSENIAKLGYSSLDELAEKILKGEVTLSKLRDKGLKPYLRLHPPKKGFKKTVKKPFNAGRKIRVPWTGDVYRDYLKPILFKGSGHTYTYVSEFIYLIEIFYLQLE